MSRLSENARVVIVTAAILLLMLLVLVLHAPKAAETTSQPSIPTVSGQMMTLEPQIIGNLTDYSKATPLAGQDANDMASLRALVDACTDYDTQRRQQMDEQIEFIINPAMLPREVIIALGTNPHAKLLFALANLTKIQWQLNKSPADSCLIPIGKRLNQLLVGSGQPPISVFEGG